MDETGKGYRNYYDRRWEKTDKVTAQPHDILLRALKEKTSGTALDLGAGAGRDALYLARNGFSVEAIDFAESGIAHINKVAQAEQLPVKAVSADLNGIKLEGHYDLITSVLVLNHLKDAEARSLLAQLKTKTKPGGVVVISTITNESDSFRKKPNAGYFYPKKDELQTLFADWEVLEYTERTVSTEAGWWTPDAATNVEAELIARKPEEK